MLTRDEATWIFVNWKKSGWTYAEVLNIPSAQQTRSCIHVLGI